jgi:hypothetical protein
MANGRNLHAPGTPQAAAAEGVPADDLAAEALRRHLAHRELEDLGEYGRGQAERLGYTEADVLRLIDESRREREA